MRASYARAVAWIAVNDETSETSPYLLAELISVMLIADLWGKTPELVARDVLHKRQQRLVRELCAKESADAS